VGETHRRYTGRVNRRLGWTGYLWQGRFASYPLEGDYLVNAVRYVERNPVRAGLVEQAWDYPWSSAAARVLGREDPLLDLAPLDGMVDDWREFLAVDPPDADIAPPPPPHRHRTPTGLGSVSTRPGGREWSRVDTHRSGGRSRGRWGSLRYKRLFSKVSPKLADTQRRGRKPKQREDQGTQT
jgi:hypothetical protein